MEKETRNTLRNTVTQCRRILEEAVGERLEGQYGIHASGKVEAEAHMGHLSPEDADYRGQLLVHVGHIQAGGYTPKEAVAQLVREVAFTHLNRLVAYKMMERRGLIREAVSRGVKSPGFLFYLADHPTDEQLWSGGQPETAYRHFLEWLGRTFAEEIRPLFAPHDPANPLFPPPRALDGVLARLNAPELADIWNEDETIGWVYQYFTPDELRREARAASSAPRNSYELAFRNQFYTPRYVVEFLSDNTLGRIWYEMRQGDTRLTEQCRYLVRRPHELFLAKGEEAPVDNDRVSVGSDPSEIQNPKSEIVPVPYRQKKDPRHLKILDPAGGSGHFLLYCFDLLVTIYEEAYTDPQLGPRLQADYPTLADLRRAMPGLILRHNLHLIDIDRRATQIAALALWLRAQRAYQEWQIPAERRPPIRKANIVCAEPMPGDKKLLTEFVAGLNPPLLGQLVRTVFDKMTLAGEAGSLLKIEVELREAIAAAKKDWEAAPKAKQLTLFAAEPQPEQIGFDLSGISDAEFWDKAEGLVLQALADYAAQATNGKGLARQLFVEDAAQGFALIDLFHQRFDVLIMNPPFGATSRKSDDYIRNNFANTWKDLYAAFFERCYTLSNTSSSIGAITSSLFLYTKQLRDFRVWLQDNYLLDYLIELGSNVLDGAAVSTALTILSNKNLKTDSPYALFLDLTEIEESSRDIKLAQEISLFPKSSLKNVSLRDFQMIEGTPFCYHLPESILQLWGKEGRIEPDVAQVVTGNTVFDNERFLRLRDEVNYKLIGTKWHTYEKGGEYQPYYSPTPLLLNWEQDGAEVRRNERANYNTDARSIQSISWWYKSGLTYPRVSSTFGPRVLPAGEIFGEKAISIFPNNPESSLPLLAILNSTLTEHLLTAFGRYRSTEKRATANLPISEDAIYRCSNELTDIARELIKSLQVLESTREPSPVFLSPNAFNSSSANQFSEKWGFDVDLAEKVKRLLDKVDEAVTRLLLGSELFAPSGVQTQKRSLLLEKYWRPLKKSPAYRQISDDWLSYSIGCAFGRWNIYFATGEHVLPNISDPFDALPVCPPGMLQNENGLPATETSADYPIEIDWDGILVDDPDHPDDIVRRVQQVLAVIWGERAAAIEEEACAILGVKELRDYFRKAGKGGFWDDHVKRYSKSRRKAPIYWLLQSSKGSYALWLYYHRLDKDLYYKALVNYVEPKLRLEENKLSQLLAHRATFGTGGKEAKQLEKEIARQEAFLSELRDFHDKLRAVAHLNLTPDLNDGVILNIAPLRELVPWKEAQAMWDELQAGKYEWSSVSKQLMGISKI